VAIIDALDRMECDEWSPYERGIAHVQLEPVYGGKADTAVQLRSNCAMAIARRPHPQKMMLLAALLADKEAPARAAAARALGFTEDSAALPLLRHKQLSGDAQPTVIGECLLAMLRIDPAQALPMVNTALRHGDAATAELAAIAMGESRLHDALPLLIDWWEHTLDQELRRTALLAIAMLRSHAGTDFLLGCIADGNAQSAKLALEALGIHKHDPAILERARLVAANREDIDLTEAFQQAFQGA
jgi:HEAT repeat protein